MIVDQDDPGAQQLTAVADGTREPSAAPPAHAAPADAAPAGAETATSPRTMFRWGVYVALGVLAVALVTISVYNTRGILIEVLIALFIAVSLDPAVRRLNRWGVRRGWAVVVILLITTGIVVGFLVSVIPSMVHQFQVLIHDFPGYVKTLQERSPSFRRFSDRYHLTTKIEDLLASLPGKISTGAITVTRRWTWRRSCKIPPTASWCAVAPAGSVRPRQPLRWRCVLPSTGAPWWS